MILQDRSGMEGGEQKRLVHLGEDLNHKLVMAGLGSAENECKKPWRQWAKMKKQTWPDPWNNQISQAVPIDYGHWNSSKQKKTICKYKLFDWKRLYGAKVCIHKN